MTKAPYTFPHKSRKAMTEYLLSFDGRSYHYERYRYAFCVKVYSAKYDEGDTLRKYESGLSRTLDSEWSDLCARDNRLFWELCEDAAQAIEYYSPYPGDDQGAWSLSFAGRSGGWIVLEKWRGYDMRNPDAETFAEMSFDDLRAFYRGIRCLEHDLTSQKASEEVEYCAAYRRAIWEEDRAEICAAQFQEMDALWQSVTA